MIATGKSVYLALEKGVIVKAEDGKQIACWPGKLDTNSFCKVVSQNNLPVAVSDPGYKGKGLVVFLDRVPGPGEVVQIKKVTDKWCAGKVLGGRIHTSRLSTNAGDVNYNR